MKKNVLFLIVLMMWLSNAFSQTFDWGIKAGNTGSDFTRAITTDANNNLYQLVFYNNTLTVDSAGTPKTIANYGNRDIAVIKYNCNRVFQWVIRIGGNNLDGGTFNNSGLAVDTNGNIYIHTTINGNVNITSANGNNQVRTSVGLTDAILIKATNAGIVQWATMQGGINNDESGGVAVGPDQNVYITGFFNGTGIFTQTSGGPTNLLSFGNSDIYIAKYSGTGVLVYANRGGGFLQDNGIGIVVDSTNSAYIAGGWGCCGNSFANFGGNNINNNGGWGAFIAKADAGGNWLWANSAGSNNTEAFADVALDEVNNRVYAIGHFNGPSTMTSRPPGTNINITTNGNYDVMGAAFDLNGSLQWVRTFGGTGIEYGYGITIDANQNPVLVGEFGSTTNFGGTTLTQTGTNSGFFAKYSRTNTLLNAQKIGNGSVTTMWDAHYSTTGLAYISGYFRDSVIVGTDTLRSGGVEDGLVVRQQENDTTYISADKTSLNCLGDTAIIYIPNKEKGNFTWYRNDTLWSVTVGNQIKTSTPGTYKVVATNACAVNDTSAGIVITRSPYYTANVIGNMTICRGDSGRFNVTGATTYRWSPATGISDTTIGNPYVKPSGNTTYYLRMVNNGCTAFDTSIVTVNTNCCLTCATPLRLNQGVLACYPFTGNANDESGNGNNATVFNATPAQDRFAVNNSAYQFDGFSSYLEVPNSASLSSPVTNNISFTFWARVSNWNFGGGVQFNPILSKSTNAASAQYRTMIRSNGVYAMQNGQSFNAVIGTTTNVNTWYFFTVTVSNDTVYYYRNGVLLGSANGPTTYTINNTTPLRIGRNDVNSTSYFNGRLDEVRIYGRTLTAAEILDLYNLSNMNGLPTVSAGADKNICKGDSVQLTTVGTNGTWLWTTNTYLSSDTARSPYSKADSTKSYIVRVDVSGCRNYDTVNVNVTYYYPTVGIDRSICKGDSLELIVQGGGNTFAWTPNYRINPLNKDTVKVYPLVDTNYIVTANNGICSRKDTIRVSVLVPNINAGPDKNVCLHDTVRFNIVTNGTVRWSPFKYLSDSVGTNVYSVPDSSVTYILTTNYLGCTTKDTVLVSVANLPVDAGPNKQICLGDSVRLQATGGANYIWLPTYRISDTSVANPWVKPLVPTYYYVVAYNALCSRYDSVFVDVKQAQANAGPDKNICNGDSAKINATVLGNYTWSPTTGLTDTTLTPYAKPLTTTTYYLTANNSGCIARDTVKVNVTVFNITAGSDQTICMGDSVQLIALGAPKYNWLPNYNISDTGIYNPWVHPMGNTNYFLIATNGICVRVDTVLVKVQTLVGSAGKDTSMCEGLSVGLNATGGTTYEWLTKYNLSDFYIPNPIATPAKDTAYVVKIRDGGTCSFYDTVRVEVNKYPTVAAGPDKIHCPGEFVTLEGSVADQENFIWTPATGLNDRLLIQPLASVTSLTQYVLVANNGYCFNTDTVEINVMPTITASFKATPNFGLAPLSVFFQNSSVNGSKYTWDFDDGGPGSTDKEPTYIFTTEGIYFVKLLVEDSLGCFDTTSTTVNVITKDFIYMPSAFTPNGDGLNDIFAPNYNPARFDFVEMSVFNRWGVEVFHTKVPGGTWWDGKINGVAEPPGIFTYSVTAKDKKGKSYELNGTVAIVR